MQYQLPKTFQQEVSEDANIHLYTNSRGMDETKS